MSGFKNFILRGNLVELAVAFIMATAFAAVVTATVALIMDVIGKIGGSPDFSSYAPGGVSVGAWLTALLSFAIMAAIVYFLIVKPYTLAKERFFPTEETGTPADVAVLEEIRDLLKAQRPVSAVPSPADQAQSPASRRSSASSPSVSEPSVSLPALVEPRSCSRVSGRSLSRRRHTSRAAGVHTTSRKSGVYSTGIVRNLILSRPIPRNCEATRAIWVMLPRSLVSDLVAASRNRSSRGGFARVSAEITWRASEETKACCRLARARSDSSTPTFCRTRT